MPEVKMFFFSYIITHVFQALSIPATHRARPAPAHPPLPHLTLLEQACAVAAQSQQ